MAGASDIFDKVSSGSGPKPKTDVFDSVSTPKVGYGVGGSWPRPTFFEGLRDSAGIPSWEETKDSLTEAYHHPIDSAVDTAKTAAAVGKFAFKYPGKFLWAMTNIPQMRDAYQQKNYAQVAGLLVGTLGQTALTFFTGEGVVPESTRGFKAGLAGKTTEEFAASERALKSARAAERADRISKLSDSIKLTITPGERLKGGKLETVESALRGFPGLSGPFQKLANQRRDAILALHDSLSGESANLKNSSQNLYAAVETRVPEFGPLQRQVTDLRKAERRAILSGNRQAAFDISQNVDVVRKQAEDVVEKSGDPVAVASWRHADSLWRRYRAKEDLRDTIEGNVVGSSAERIATQGATAEAPRRPQVQSLTKDLETLQRDGTLEAALGKQRADQLIRVASLYDRVRKTNSGYMAERILGYAMIGSLPFLPKGYVFDVAAGAAGGMLVSWALLKGGSTTVLLDGFLRASEAGDIQKANRYAATLSNAARFAEREAAAQAAARKNAPRKPIGPMSDAERLRLSVPLSLQPRPEEDPLRDMLNSLLGEMTTGGKSAEQGLQSSMETAAAKKRTGFREAEAVAEAKRQVNQ